MTHAEQSKTRLVVLGAALVGSLQLLRFAGPQFAVDDSWISFRIARNLLEHGRLTYDVAYANVEGMTNLLWTLLSLTWTGLLPNVDPIFPARIFGGALHLATLGVALRTAVRVARRHGASPVYPAFAVAAVLAASGSMAYHAMSGLETSLWALLFLLSMDRLEAAWHGDPKAATLAGCWLGLLALCRPEGVGIGLVIGAFLVAQRDGRRWAHRTLIPFVAAVVAVEVFRWLVYGSLVPNTFFAKPPYPTDGLLYLGRFLVFGLGGLGVAALLPALRRDPFARMLGVVALAALAGTIWSGGDWMPGYRRFTVAFLCVALLASLGIATLRGASRRWVSVAVVCIVVGNLAAAVRSHDHAVYNTHVMAGLGGMAARSPDVHEVALTDIGRFGWAFGESIFDLAGLTDAHIARQSGAHARKSWDEAYFRERAPDLVMVQNDRPFEDTERIRFRTRPSEAGVVDSIMTTGGYGYVTSARIGDDLWMLVFRRLGVELPSEVWGTVAPMVDLANSRREPGS